MTWWELLIGGCAIVAGAVAIWVTLSADFLAHPGWLALQKADLIVGPVFVGLYWLRRRPRSRFGPLLIACGFSSVPYILQSSPEPVLFSLGLLAEPIVLLASLTLILAFPTGRLDRWPERLVLIGAVVIGVVPYLVTILVSPVLIPAGTISGCSGRCPDNGLLVHANPQLAAAMVDQYLASITAFSLATLAVVGWRLATATAPRRRALATGAPIAVFFLTTAAAHRFLTLIDVDAPELMDVLAWALVIARSSIWYGFLLALIAAQLFAGRVLLRIVGESLRRPSVRELEAMLRDPLGDPALRLAFRRRGRKLGGLQRCGGGRAAGGLRPDGDRGRARGASAAGHLPRRATLRGARAAARGRRRCAARRRERRTRVGVGRCAWRTCRTRARGPSWPATESGAGSSATSTTASSSDLWPR